MRQPRIECPSCGGSVRLLDSYSSYSTTRGPMAHYDMVVCSTCDEMNLLSGAANNAERRVA
ncbi:MAG: hypothetical protein KDC39_12825 [Actinobacteria bacterium]|nr:hypothetical protein [Actinomycetota bacterium]